MKARYPDGAAGTDSGRGRCVEKREPGARQADAEWERNWGELLSAPLCNLLEGAQTHGLTALGFANPILGWSRFASKIVYTVERNGTPRIWRPLESVGGSSSGTHGLPSLTAPTHWPVGCPLSSRTGKRSLSFGTTYVL